MGEKQCTIEECNNKLKARGYCSKHYGKWKKYGDPLKGVSRNYQGEESAIRLVYKKYKESSRKRKKANHFEIEFEDFKWIIKENCFYCGKGPSNLKKTGSYNLYYNGLDRINNRVGYTYKNVVPACKECNFMRGRKGFKRFFNWVVRIKSNWEDRDIEIKEVLKTNDPRDII